MSGRNLSHTNLIEGRLPVPDRAASVNWTGMLSFPVGGCLQTLKLKIVLKTAPRRADLCIVDLTKCLPR